MATNKDKILKLDKAADKARKMVTSKRNSQRFADAAKLQIQRRTRLGKGVTEDGKSYRLPELSEPYKKTRKAYKRNLSSTTSPGRGRSNATATGQLLNSIVAKGRKFFIEVSVKDARGDGLTDDAAKGLTNSKLIEYLAALNITFFKLANFELKKVIRNPALKQIETLIRFELKKT